MYDHLTELVLNKMLWKTTISIIKIGTSYNDNIGFTSRVIYVVGSINKASICVFCTQNIYLYIVSKREYRFSITYIKNSQVNFIKGQTFIYL